MTEEFERRLKTIRGYSVLSPWGRCKVKQIFWPERRALITLDLGCTYTTSLYEYASIEFEADGAESIMCDLDDLKPLNGS